MWRNGALLNRPSQKRFSMAEFNQIWSSGIFSRNAHCQSNFGTWCLRLGTKSPQSERKQQCFQEFQSRGHFQVVCLRMVRGCLLAQLPECAPSPHPAAACFRGSHIYAGSHRQLKNVQCFSVCAWCVVWREVRGQLWSCSLISHLFWGSSSGCQSCATNTLPTKLSHQPQIGNFFKNRFSV